MLDRIANNLNVPGQVLSLRHNRQSLLASNIANADTPGYKARDINFAQALDKARPNYSRGGDLQLTATHQRHFAPESPRLGDAPDALYRPVEQPSMDGNSVDMDVERAHFADNSVRYQAAINMVNSRISGLRSAMKSEV